MILTIQNKIIIPIKIKITKEQCTAGNRSKGRQHDSLNFGDIIIRGFIQVKGEHFKAIGFDEFSLRVGNFVIMNLN